MRFCDLRNNHERDKEETFRVKLASAVCYEEHLAALSRLPPDSRSKFIRNSDGVLVRVCNDIVGYHSLAALYLMESQKKYQAHPL
jgi:hypothetical protein